MVPRTKDNGPNFIRSFTIKILNKRELQQIAIKHSADMEYKIFMDLYKKCLLKPYYFFLIDTLSFTKNINNNHDS